MSKRTWIIVGLLVAVGILMTAVIERRAALQQAAQAETLKEQAARIALAAAENARLSDLAAQATTPEPVSGENLRELVRLRNEMGQLRRLAEQKAQLEAANARLREADKKSQEMLAQTRALPNYWPKDQLAFAGYAEPASTVRSLLAALKNGDLTAMLACFDPAIVAKMEASMQQDLGDPATRTAVFKSMVGDFLAGSDGFHIVDQTMTASNEVIINLSFDGQDRVQNMVLKKTGNEWKLTGGFQK